MNVWPLKEFLQDCTDLVNSLEDDQIEKISSLERQEQKVLLAKALLNWENKESMQEALVHEFEKVFNK